MHTLAPEDRNKNICPVLCGIVRNWSQLHTDIRCISELLHIHSGTLSHWSEQPTVAHKQHDEVHKPIAEGKKSDTRLIDSTCVKSTGTETKLL